MADGSISKYRSALGTRDLRTLIIAFIVDGGASWSYSVVLVAYVYARTHSATWITATLTVGWVTGMLCGTYAGVLADRYDRRRVLIVSATAAMVVALVLAALVEWNAPLVTILIAAAVQRASATPVRPASGALIPEVTDESDLIAANSIFALLESLIVVIGPGIGALLLLSGRPVFGVLLNAASYLVSALLYLRLQVRSRGDAEPGGNLVDQWTAGVRALAQHRTAFVLTVFLLLDSGAVNAANALMPALAQHLHGGRTGYSLLIGANALGGVFIAALANKLAASPRVTAIIMLSIVVECLPLWLCVYVGHVPPAIVLQVVSGAGMVVVDVIAFTALQRDLPREVLGRVLGSVDVLLLATSIVSAFVGSQLLVHAGIGWALGLIGIGFPALCLLGLPSLRRLDAHQADEVAALQVRVGLLDALDLFTGAPQALLERLATAASAETVAAGAVLIRQGDDADALWVLTEGRLSVSAVDDRGATIELPPVVAPGYVGELGLLHHRPRTATVVTATECALLKIPGPEFQDALEQATPSSVMLGRAGARLARTSGPTPF
jgi:CRP-like cAMP-binding protein/Na+/melibiose symporter-like transporter